MNLAGYLSIFRDTPDDLQANSILRVGRAPSNATEVRSLLVIPRNPPEASALVLVVERDPHVRELEAFFLNEAGFSVQFAEDGFAALEIARSSPPSIVVTEILVPKLDGLALCRTLKQDPRLQHIPVLVFSILAASGRAKEAGADFFLMKPLAERRLVDTVRELLARRIAVAAKPETA